MTGSEREEFDRIRPPSERVLRRGDDGHLNQGDTASRAGDGREALFSAGRNGSSPSGVALRCSRCAAATDLDARTALKAALPLVLVAPWRQEPVFARCPACQRRSWLAIELGG